MGDELMANRNDTLEAFINGKIVNPNGSNLTTTGYALLSYRLQLAHHEIREAAYRVIVLDVDPKARTSVTTKRHINSLLHALKYWNWREVPDTNGREYRLV